jgi:hypothetical protein
VVIARKRDISTEQTRALEQHGKLIGRVKPAHRKCLEKGWWKTGERKRVKGRHEHFVWERRVREQDNGAGVVGGGGRDRGGARRHGGGHRLGKVLGSIPSPLNSEPEDIPASASKRPKLRHGKVHGGNRWIVETAPEEGRGRGDGSGVSMAPGSRHAQGEGKCPMGHQGRKGESGDGRKRSHKMCAEGLRATCQAQGRSWQR